MPWVRLDEHFPEHRKILAAGGDAAWLHVCAISYAARNLTDGHIPATVLDRLSDRRHPAKLAARLVEVGLWQLAPDGWMIHDFLDYQPSAAKVREGRDAAAERQRRAREAAAAKRAAVTPMSQRDSQRDSRCDMAVSHGPPDPTRPVSTDIPPRVTNPGPVDNPGGREQQIATAYLDHARQRAGQITHPTSWEAKVNATFDTLRPKLRTLLAQFPDAPTDTLVHALDTGDTRNLAYYRRPTHDHTDPLASIHELHPPKGDRMTTRSEAMEDDDD